MMIGDVIIEYDFIIDVSDRVEKTIGGKCLICFYNMVRYGGGFRYGAAYSIIAEYATLRNKKSHKI